MSACSCSPKSPLPGPSTHSRVSAGMCSLSLRDFMPRPGPRLRDRVLTPPSWPPSPDCVAIGQTDRRGRRDSTPGRRDRRGVGPGQPGGGVGGGAGSLRPGAGLGAPHLRAGTAPQQRSDCARREPWCHPSRAGTPRGPGIEAPSCTAGKEGQSLPSLPDLLLHQLAPPLPGRGRTSALTQPRPAPPPGGVSRTPDLSVPRPNPPTRSRSAQAFPAAHSGCQHPGAHRRPRPRLQPLASLGSLCQDSHPPHSYPNSAPPASSLHVDPWRSEPHPPSCPAQTPKVWGCLCLAIAPLKSWLDPVRHTAGGKH